MEMGKDHRFGRIGFFFPSLVHNLIHLIWALNLLPIPLRGVLTIFLGINYRSS